MENEKRFYPEFHSLSEIQEIPEGLKSVFEDAGIGTIEQAVSFLSSLDVDIEGRENFLVNANDIMEKTAFQKYSTPVESHPLGCDEPESRVKIAVESNLLHDEPVAEKVDHQSEAESDEILDSAVDVAVNDKQETEDEEFIDK